MKFVTISNADHPQLDAIKELYLAAFPRKERRDWVDLLHMLGRVPEMELKCMEDGDQFIGFLVSWSLANWHYIEHFAIEPAHRGKQYGELVMQTLLADGKALILEVEPPATENARRRIQFYERLGLKCLYISYEQPSYHDPDCSYPLILMSNFGEQEAQAYRQILLDIRLKVYGRV